MSKLKRLTKLTVTNLSLILVKSQLNQYRVYPTQLVPACFLHLVFHRIIEYLGLEVNHKNNQAQLPALCLTT